MAVVGLSSLQGCAGKLRHRDGKLAERYEEINLLDTIAERFRPGTSQLEDCGGHDPLPRISENGGARVATIPCPRTRGDETPPSGRVAALGVPKKRDRPISGPTIP